MMRRFIASALLIALCVPAFTTFADPSTKPAPTTQAATTQPSPTTQAATTQPAKGTPAYVVQELAAAMLEGDPTVIKKHLHGDTELEKQMVSRIADLAGALAGMRQAAIRKFGADAAKELTGDLEAQRKAIEGLGTANVMMAQDFAEVRPGIGDPVRLKKIDGAWKVPVKDAASGLEGKESRWLMEVQAREKVCRGIRFSIDDGTLKNVDEVLTALDERLRVAIGELEAAQNNPIQGPPAPGPLPAP